MDALMGAAQLDLFAAPARPRVSISAPSQEAAKIDMPPAVDLASILPRRPSPAWQRRLDDARHKDAFMHAPPPELFVSQLWSGVVIEVLSLPTHRIYLHHDGTLQDPMPPDGAEGIGRIYRAVFVTVAEARKLAARVPLRLLSSSGAACLRLGQARPGSAAPPWADLPDWLDGIEAAAPEKAA
jgi:hypothetical protein